ncbi:MAG: class I SAM-dependent methyltransferase [Deltaproteobacteria bacterium]|nr:class I SAM-dependent methyltransferase [Deltaproteobacteria bacterium]
MNSPWPDGFARIPDADWVSEKIDTLARKYDSVEHHGWYRNLDPTVDRLRELVTDGDIVIDYSGGTGILTDRLLRACPDLNAGWLIVDSSPKFLRLALEKLRDETRVAFRLIRYLKPERRLQLLDEVLGAEPASVHGLVSTNAVHLYYDLPETVASWVRVLRPNAYVLVQSGNIRNPDAEPGSWIIDETVEAIHENAVEIVRSDARFLEYRPGLDDDERCAKYASLRNKYFLPVRPLDTYLGVFRDAGLTVEEVTCLPVQARVVEWFEFLAAYHEGVLGWVGGVERIEGRAASEETVRDRLTLIREGLDRLFEGKDGFRASWTHITCRTPR